MYMYSILFIYMYIHVDVHVFFNFMHVQCTVYRAKFFYTRSLFVCLFVCLFVRDVQTFVCLHN